MFEIETDDTFGNIKVFAKNANRKEEPKKTIIWTGKGVRVGNITYHFGVSLPGGLILALGLACEK